jgi:hypothetical protein
LASSGVLTEASGEAFAILKWLSIRQHWKSIRSAITQAGEAKVKISAVITNIFPMIQLL